MKLIDTPYTPEVIKAIMDEIDPYLPLVNEVADKLAPVISTLIERADKYLRAQRAEEFQYYLSKGFERKEALLLMINSKVALAEMITNIGSNNKKK